MPQFTSNLVKMHYTYTFPRRFYTKCEGRAVNPSDEEKEWEGGKEKRRKSKAEGREKKE